MSDDSSPRLMRYRLVQSLVPLAASGETLVEYVHERDLSIDDALSDYVDWTYDAIPWLEDEGLLPGEVPARLEKVFELCLAAMSAAPEASCEDAVQRPEFLTLRQAATDALAAFRRLGVPVPNLRPGLYDDSTTIPESER